MVESIFSSSWYRVAELKPKLGTHARLHRHRYRGSLWYVLEDLSSERYHRFTPSAYKVIALMDGEKTVQEIWEQARDQLGEDAPTQDELIQLLTQLHFADALQTDAAPNIHEMLERASQQRRSKVTGQLLSPLFWKVPLYDPERLLNKGMPFVRPLISVPGMILWVSVVLLGSTLITIHWTDLTEGFMDRVLAPRNLALIWLIFPVLKTFHEFGHAFATKAFGGQVHEMGIMMLVITPLPYVDASSASSFRLKRQRILVGAAGMIVEVFLASLAAIVWTMVEPGLVRTMAFNAMFIGGISTLLFNVNPLLRYDGYYILSDLLEIPNLRSRSTRHLAYLGERYLLGNEKATLPESTHGERVWFCFFGVASFFYRILVVTGIILFVASRFFFIGVLFALYSLIGWVVLPLSKGLRSLFTSSRLRRRRTRAAIVVASALGFAIAGTCLVPFPLNTTAEGVIWVPENSIVRAGADGFIDEVVATPGDRVVPGDVLLVGRNPELDARVKTLRARLAELEANYSVERVADPRQAEIVRDEIEHVEESLRSAEEELRSLTVRSAVEGTFVMPNSRDLPGRFVPRGAPIARVMELQTLTARVVVGQSDIDHVRNQTRAVDVRLAERPAVTASARILREVPGASDRLPSTALGSHGGGQIPVDPRDERGTQAIAKLFQFDLELDVGLQVINVGGRVFVRFSHGWEPIGYRWYRQARQLFMRRFSL